MSRAEDGLLLHLKKSEVMGMSGHQIAYELVRLETENAALHDRVAVREKEGAEYEEQVDKLEDELLSLQSQAYLSNPVNRYEESRRFEGVIETEGYDF